MVKSNIQKVTATLSPSESWKDTFVRAAKTAVATLITGLPLNQFADLNLETIQVVAFAAAAAGGSVILNAVLRWANS